MKKKFLISIDTEGDNLWEWEIGKTITTRNARYLFRFQHLCDEFGFKPTYLTNYEMAMDEKFVEFATDVLKRNGCEIGMHLHAWNSPPEYELPCSTRGIPGAPFLTEYPDEVMDEKIKFMTELIETKFGQKPITHRAGRWAMNRKYFELLDKYEYVVDCSVTPRINWSTAAGQTEFGWGSDYTRSAIRPYLVPNTGILEIPMTVRENRRLQKNPGEGIRKALRNYYNAIKGKGNVWLRPNGSNLPDLLYLVDKVAKNPADDYIMFMLHSSELMPGGSRRFDTDEKVEKLYSDIETVFTHLAKYFEGITIGDYAVDLKKSYKI